MGLWSQSVRRTLSSETASECVELGVEWDTESNTSKRSINTTPKPSDLKTAVKARSLRARDMNIR